MDITYIDITGCDLRKFVAKVYDLSRPQGLGFLHFTREPLTDAEIDLLIWPGESYLVRMDYVKGRSCKMTVFNREGRLTIYDSWYDHSDEQLNELLAHVGVQRQEV